MLYTIEKIDTAHVGEDHSRDLLRRVFLRLTGDGDLNERLAVVVDDIERPVLAVLLDGFVVKSATDQTLRVKDGVAWVHGRLVLGRVTVQALIFGEGNVRWRRSVTLLVGNDLNTSVVPYTNARVAVLSMSFSFLDSQTR